jgi:hypothetical protein
MTSTDKVDHDRALEMVAQAASALRRLKHNLKVLRRKKAEEDARFEVKEKAELEDIEEQRREIQRVLDRNPDFAKKYGESFTHLLEDAAT